MPQEGNEASKLFVCAIANHSTLKASVCKTVQCSWIVSLNRDLGVLSLLRYCNRKHRITLAINSSRGSLESMF